MIGRSKWSFAVILFLASPASMAFAQGLAEQIIGNWKGNVSRTEKYWKDNKIDAPNRLLSDAGRMTISFTKGNTLKLTRTREPDEPFKVEGTYKITNSDEKTKELKLDLESSDPDGPPKIEVKVKVFTYEGLTFVVSKSNKFVEMLELAQLKTIFLENGPNKWKDLNPAWPNRPIKFYMPEKDSAAYQDARRLLEEEGEKEEDKKKLRMATSEQKIETLNDLNSDRFGIGFLDYSEYEANKEKLETLRVELNTAIAITPPKDPPMIFTENYKTEEEGVPEKAESKNNEKSESKNK